MKRGRPLVSTKGLSRSPWPSPPADRPDRRAAFKPAAKTGNVVPLGAARPLRASRAEVPRAVRRMVLERDGYACVCCGVSVIGRRYSLGHRLRASQGGKAVPSNLLTFLGWGGEECHGRIDLYRDPADEAKGYRIRSGTGPGYDPLYVPVMLFSAGGSGCTMWLTDDGRYSTEPPQDGAA